MRTFTVILAIALILGTHVAISAAEVMTDQCSAEVAIVPSYSDIPPSNGTVILKRRPNGSTDWTPPIIVKLDSVGHIRWFCHSTTGNTFDIGTWRITDIFIGEKCDIFADNSPKHCNPVLSIKRGSSAWNGWTPERSRCRNRSTRIRARLGPGRLLQIECLGR